MRLFWIVSFVYFEHLRPIVCELNDCESGTFARYVPKSSGAAAGVLAFVYVQTLVMG